MKSYIVDKKNDGKKLFNYIKTVLPGLKNSEIFKLIRKKVITINNKRESPDYLLKENDNISLYLKEIHFDKKGRKNKFQSVNKTIDVVFEDKNVLIINKPKGILSQPNDSDYKNNIYEIARSYLYDKGEYKTDDVFTPALCNRIDRNTSGIIVLAKNHNSLKEITRQFRERNTIKTYIAIVCGKIDKEYLLVSQINDKNEIVEIKDFKIMEKIPDKTDFFNNYPLLQATYIKPILTNENASFVNIDLWTGKKHQIRAHMKAFKHPLLGDRKYFTVESNNKSNYYNIKSYLLHSYKLKLNNYEEFTTEIPEEFKKVIFKIFNKSVIDY